MTKSPSKKEPAQANESIRAVRKARARSLRIKLGAFVFGPSILAAVYLWGFSTDRFESVAVFSIQAAENRPNMAMESLVGLAGVSSTGRDTLAAREFVLSREMLSQLDEETGLLDHFRSNHVDYVSRLPQRDSFEDAYNYYLDRVKVAFDSNSGTMTLRVQAFSAEMAQKIADTILRASEAKVNQLTQKARTDQIKLAETDLTRAEKRLSDSRQELVTLQQKHGQFSPAQTAEAALTIRTELEAKLAEAKAEYATLRSYMAKTSPQVVAAQQRVNALSTQARNETTRLVDNDEKKGLNRSLVEFETVLVEKEFATAAYQSALGSLELARADASRQHRYLAVVAKPSKPDEATFPRRYFSLISTFLATLVIFGVFSLSWSAIKEHAKL